MPASPAEEKKRTELWDVDKSKGLHRAREAFLCHCVREGSVGALVAGPAGERVPGRRWGETGRGERGPRSGRCNESRDMRERMRSSGLVSGAEECKESSGAVLCEG